MNKAYKVVIVLIVVTTLLVINLDSLIFGAERPKLKGKIAFVSHKLYLEKRGEEEKCKEGYAIWAMNADGSDRTRITKSIGLEESKFSLDACDSAPGGLNWSPDGKVLAFHQPQSWIHPPSLFVINSDGTNLKLLTKGGCNPDWSPDSKWLVFSGGEIVLVTGKGYKLKEENIYKIEIDGKNLQLLAKDGHNPKWSPDGKRIAFIRETYIKEKSYNERKICFVGSDSRDEKVLISTKEVKKFFWLSERKIVFQTETSYIQVIDISNSTVQKILPIKRERGEGSLLSCSPDGKKIIFFLREKVDGKNGCSIWIMGADGKDPKRIIFIISDLSFARYHCWSPDGKWLAIATYDGNIRLVNIESGEMYNISNNPPLYNASNPYPQEMVHDYCFSWSK